MPISDDAIDYVANHVDPEIDHDPNFDLDDD